MKLNTTKHSSLALACVLASGAAVADTGVTVYGRANISVESQKVGGQSETAMVDNQSRVGVRATRDIAGGMTVGATLEAGLNFTDGQTRGNLFAREASVGVGGSFGQVKAGRFPASVAYFATADYVSNHNHDTGSSADALYDAPAIASGMKSALYYASPKLGSLQLEAQYGFKKGVGMDSSGSTATTVDRSQNPVALAANYTAGALALGLGYERGDNYVTDDTTDYASQVTARAFYTMGAFGFGGYLQKSSGTQFDRNAYRLSGMYTMGQNEFHLNFGAAGNRGGVANTGAKQFTLGYNFNLDKQTKLYAFYTKVDNESGAKYGTDNRYFANPTVGQDLSSVGVGMRYNF